MGLPFPTCSPIEGETLPLEPYGERNASGLVTDDEAEKVVCGDEPTNVVCGAEPTNVVCGAPTPEVSYIRIYM